MIGGTIFKYKIKKNTYSGFTLIEVLVVVAIFLVLLSSNAAILGSRSQQKGLDASAKAIVEHISKARNYASTGYFDDAWGVKILDNSAPCFNNGDCVVVFKGNNYATRNSIYDSIFDLKNGLNWSGSQSNEYYFSAVAGWLSTTTAGYEMSEQRLVLTNAFNELKVVSTTPAGLVYYGD